MFDQSVDGFLRRYQADARFAQEARKRAAGVLGGSVALTCPAGLRPQALKLLPRLATSPV